MSPYSGHQEAPDRLMQRSRAKTTVHAAREPPTRRGWRHGHRLDQVEAIAGIGRHWLQSGSDGCAQGCLHVARVPRLAVGPASCLAGGAAGRAAGARYRQGHRPADSQDSGAVWRRDPRQRAQRRRRAGGGRPALPQHAWRSVRAPGAALQWPAWAAIDAACHAAVLDRPVDAGHRDRYRRLAGPAVVGGAVSAGRRDRLPRVRLRVRLPRTCLAPGAGRAAAGAGVRRRALAGGRRRWR